jgi:propanol-preferring alcohol dehydrogenase
MRAQVLEQGGRPLRLVERETPRPGPGQVLIRVRACGVCHTDLHLVDGELTPPRLPLIPGHQVVGVIEAGGEGTGRLRPGSRVGVAWLHEACGACDDCRRGLENLCDRVRFTGFHVDGGYAEQIIAPERFVYPLPETFPDAEAAPLLCAGIIGFRALKVCGAQRGERVALFGFGASAHLTLQIARWRGCQVDVYSRAEEHRRLALELGAGWAGQAGEAAPAPADRAILFAPSGRLIPIALRALRKAGTLAIAVIHLDQVPAFDYALLFEERVVRTVTASTRRDGEEFLEEAVAARLRVAVEPFPLAEAGRALDLLREGRIRGAGVLLPA